MHTPPPERTLPPKRDPFTILVTWDDLEHLEHAQHELDRARLLLGCAVECDERSQREHRRMLIDGAADAFAPAYVELVRVLRLFAIRARAERIRRAKRDAARTTPLPERGRYQTKKFRAQAHRR